MDSDATITIPIAPGELFDRLGILNIKLGRIESPEKRKNIAYERQLLLAIAIKLDLSADIIAIAEELEAINAQIWELEDIVRNCEREKRFDDQFIRTARLIYRTNDARARLKRTINEALKSNLIEEKSYAEYE